MMKNLGLDLNAFEDDGPICLQFSYNGFESMQFIANIGSSILFILLYLIIWVINFILMKISYYFNILLGV